MKVNLEGQVALVTGAARGIGQAIADALGANGARVVYADVDLATAEKSATKWPEAVALRMDVTNETEIDAVLAETLRRWAGSTSSSITQASTHSRTA